MRIVPWLLSSYFSPVSLLIMAFVFLISPNNASSHNTSIVPTLPSTTIVISEFRTRGPSGGNDEFIEIMNISSTAVDISGWKINGSNSATPPATSTRVTIDSPTTLGPGCRFLVTNTNSSGGYSGEVAGNKTYTTGIVDTGGIAILMPNNTIVDQVGMSAGSAYKEGDVLAPMTGLSNQSYERKPVTGSSRNRTDTDNNNADFQLNTGSSNPENLSSDCTLAVSLASFTAEAMSNNVRLTWETLSEVDTLGFDLYRSVESQGPGTKITPSLIPAQAPGSGQGAMYEWKDEDVLGGNTYFYWLEDVDASGLATRHGPTSITYTPAPTTITLGSLSIARPQGDQWGLAMLILVGVFAMLGFISQRRSL